MSMVINISISSFADFADHQACIVSPVCKTMIVLHRVTLEREMIVLFHAICFVFAELSTPVWQREVRQITSQVVEAMCEAEET